MSKLLIDDQPLQVLPALAEAIGLNEALILQQIHWLLERSRNKVEDKSWVYNTYEQWKSNHFRFFSLSTIRRAIDNLEKLGLLISTTKFNKMKVDKTKWYSIDYQALEALEITSAKNNRPSAQNEQSDCSNWTDVSAQIEQTNNQENIQETPTRDNTPLPPGESANTEQQTAGSGEKIKSNNPKNLPVDYQGVMEEFNLAVADTRISQIRVMSEQRKRAVHSLAKLIKREFDCYTREAFGDYFRDFVEQANARLDKFYFGGLDGSRWVADFDYILRAKTFAKTVENSL